jgi:hypothetical protein
MLTTSGRTWLTRFASEFLQSPAFEEIGAKLVLRHFFSPKVWIAIAG